MKRAPVMLPGAAVALALSAPALAQHAGHGATAPDPHAGHTMPAPTPTPTPVPTSAAVADPHAGHVMPDAPSAPDPHAGHALPQAGPAGTDMPAGASPPPLVPSERAADAVYGAEAMAMGRHHLDHFHGGQKLYRVMANIAEVQVRKGRNGYEWDGEAWYGGDIDRLWLKSEGDGTFGEAVERAELQALYSRAIDPYFNLQAGLRYDFRPDPSRIYATAGFQGLAPGFVEVEGALFASNKGELMARGEAHYDERITQRLILQPRAELNFAAQDSRRIGVGAGLSDAEIGLRLRYDIVREVAPYVGVQYRRAFGATRRFRVAGGDDAKGWAFVAGLRTWF